MNRVTNMTSGNPMKLILTFSVPLILANFGQQLYMIVDAIIVGRGVGVDALAAVGATDWSYWLALWVIQALTQGFAIPISHHFGSGDSVRLRRSVTMSVRLCLIIGIIMTAVFLIIARPLLDLLQTPDDIFAGASEYLITMYGGLLIVMAYNMASSILRALGDGRTPLVAIAIAAVTNIALDLIFVFIFHWGIFGAAIATVTAQLLAFIYCFNVLRKMDLMKMDKEDWIFRKDIAGNQFRLGFPLAVQHIFVAAGGMILQSAINKHGFIFIAGFTATNKIYGLMESSAISLGYSVSTYTAQNYGAGLFSRIKKGLRSSALAGLVFAVIVMAAMIAAGRPILSLFIDTSGAAAAETLNIAYHYLFIMSSLLIALYMLHIFKNTLQGLGDTITPFISGIMEFAARVSMAYLFTALFGDELIFFAEPTAWIAAAIVLVAVCIIKVKKLPASDQT